MQKIYEPRTLWLLIGGLFYLLGSFLVTIRFNVPLNKALAKASWRQRRDLGLMGVIPFPMDHLEPRANGRIARGHRRVHSGIALAPRLTRSAW